MFVEAEVRPSKIGDDGWYIDELAFGCRSEHAERASDAEISPPGFGAPFRFID